MDIEGLKVSLRKVGAHGRPRAEDVRLWALVLILKNQMTWKDKPEKKSQTPPPTPTSTSHTHLGNIIAES